MLIRVPLIQMFYFPFHVAECCFCMCVCNELSSKLPLFKCMNCLVVGKVYQAVIQLRSNVKCFCCCCVIYSDILLFCGCVFVILRVSFLHNVCSVFVVVIVYILQCAVHLLKGAMLLPSLGHFLRLLLYS